jgi:heme/copper-type cytochrome/quinol oxidase subunit 2
MFVTTLISSVSFLLNVLPVRAGEESLELMAGDIAPPLFSRSELILRGILFLVCIFVVFPIVIVLLANFLWKITKARKTDKAKSKKTKK